MNRCTSDTSNLKLDIYDSIVSRFPEDLYPSYSSDYFERVIRGYELMSQSSVFICGIVRDIECNVRHLVARIKNLASLFKSSNYYFYENDSTDNTVSLFRQFLELDSEKLETGKLYDKSLQRRINMARARNKYLVQAKEAKADYTIVIDTDVHGGYSYDGIANSISYGYDVITSNGLIYENNTRLFYDTWAYRKFNNENDLGEIPNLLKLDRGDAPIRVFSGFGGMAVYNQSIQHPGLSYTSEDCDHVTLHKQMRKVGYSVWLNPSQIVLYNETLYRKIK